MRKLVGGLLALLAAPALCAPAPPPLSVDAAHEALLYDLSSGTALYARNPSARLLPASMTKAMTTLVAFDLIAAGTLKENDVVTVSPVLSSQWAGLGTSLFLRPNEKVSVHDLLMGITTASANDAAIVLARHAAGSQERWAAWMNATAQGIGMSGSHFGTPNGWPDQGRTFVTARDLVTLARVLVERHPDLYRRYIGHPSFLWRGMTLRNHDPLLGVVTGADGIKTGHTNEAGFNFLGSVVRGDRRLLLVVAGAPTPAARAQASRDLVEWGFAEWTLHRVLNAGETVGTARVQGGAAISVPLVATRAVSLTLARGAAVPARPVPGRIVYTGPLKAPIRAGTVVAALLVEQPGLPIQRVPLSAASNVAPAGVIDRLRNGLIGLWS
ncbi:D-alanyl-D-alanine carboxypeptidase family protein [Parablastomonas sp. CN1-191]|uniref:D-alanyl-D-alanine carboxypeptidase family protein n=1 Tax=Parablastomonas sp. CN1-191 TaxID=3400908 RepID=UPI003BF83A51